jgi:DNA-directed RNA polymerase subunit alpha
LRPVKGYVPADRNRLEDAPIGLHPRGFAVQSGQELTHKVENTAKAKFSITMFSTMTVETNGAVSAENAVAYAARILQDQLQVAINS